MPWLSLFFGGVVGLSLGLTGGGGAIFAVPLLVYGLHVPAREAVGISLASVGMTAFVGFLARWKLGQVETRTGLLFAVAGMLGAPVGAWIAGRLPETAILLSFAGLMVVVAVRMWRQATLASQTADSSAACSTMEDRDGPTCRRDKTGSLILTSRCALLLLLLGLLTGVLSGLYGVGGGFVIVPALVMFSGMSIHRAVGTSLMVIALVSVSGIAAQLLSGRPLPPMMTSLFIVGGVGGLLAGQRVGPRLSGPSLQKTFVVAIVAVACLVIVRNLAA